MDWQLFDAHDTSVCPDRSSASAAFAVAAAAIDDLHLIGCLSFLRLIGPSDALDFSYDLIGWMMCL